MPDEVSISQMRLGERDDVLAFLKTAYADNPRHSDPKFWNWHFPDSPFCDPDDLPIWIAKDGKRVVGQLAATPVRFNVGGKEVDAIWILDLIIDPAYRRRGIARKFALASKEYCPYVLGVNTSAQHSTELLEGLGWNIFAKIPRYQKLLFPGTALKETSRIAPVRTAVDAVFAPFRPGRKTLLGQMNGVRSVDGFDGSFDTLWEASRRQWQCSISRTSAMLDWQFTQQPGKRFEILARFDDAEELMGYAVVFVRKADANGALPKAAISDICYHPADAKTTADALIAAAIDLCIDRRIGSLVTDVIDPLITSALNDAGFRQVPSTLQLLANVSDEDQATVYDASNWFLTRGDSDISIFEDPNIDG